MLLLKEFGGFAPSVVTLPQKLGLHKGHYSYGHIKRQPICTYSSSIASAVSNVPRTCRERESNEIQT